LSDANLVPQKKKVTQAVSLGLAVEPAPSRARPKVPVRLLDKIRETTEPVVGLRCVTETLAVSDPEQEPHYTCRLCGQQGQANCMLQHLWGRAHRQAWLRGQRPGAGGDLSQVQTVLTLVEYERRPGGAAGGGPG
jgi:hypothetical protein